MAWGLWKTKCHLVYFCMLTCLVSMCWVLYTVAWCDVVHSFYENSCCLHASTWTSNFVTVSHLLNLFLCCPYWELSSEHLRVQHRSWVGDGRWGPGLWLSAGIVQSYFGGAGMSPRSALWGWRGPVIWGANRQPSTPSRLGLLPLVCVPCSLSHGLEGQVELCF